MPTNSDIFQALYDASAEIGQVQNNSVHYMARLGLLAARAGKPINDLTVGELRQLIAQNTKDYNQQRSLT